jgi:hypothetical protein
MKRQLVVPSFVGAKKRSTLKLPLMGAAFAGEGSRENTAANATPTARNLLNIYVPPLCGINSARTETITLYCAVLPLLSPPFLTD